MRVYPDSTGHLFLKPGDYGKDADGQWTVRPLRGGTGMLEGHTVVEHEDGTITVYPSIVAPGYHGFLVKGVWREC